MDLNSFSSLLASFIAHGYILMFLMMCLEGPLATAVGAFAVALGYFNLYAVIALSILGDIVPDTILYYIGYFSREKVIEKYGHRFGLTFVRMDKIENLIKNHAIKTVTAMKFTPLLPFFGFMLVGTARFSFSRFLTICFTSTLVKTATFMIIGYYFGRAYNFTKYVKYGEYSLFIIIILAVLVFFIYRKFFGWISKKIEKI